MSSTDRTKTRLDAQAMTEAKQAAIGKVGYGRPPAQAQWQKGQSGNPKGRPPKQRRMENESPPKEVRDAVLDSLRQTHRVSDGRGGEKEITRLDALNLRQQKAALDGNPKALEDALTRAERMLADEQRELAVINDAARLYQQDCWRQIEDAKAAGKLEPVFFVHPDDMIIEDGKPIQYSGPVGPDAQAAIHDAASARDLAIMQAALEDKMFNDGYLKPQHQRRETAFLWAVMLNDALPPRWQLCDFDFGLAYERQFQKPKRQLLKEVYAGWRERGVDARRGTALPTIGQTQQIIEMLAGTIRQKRHTTEMSSSGV